MIADNFAEKGYKVIYICGKGSIQPSKATEETIVIQGVKDLEQAVFGLSNKYSFDCIVHSMAVSDYTVKSVMSYDVTNNRILEDSNSKDIKNGKLSSDMSNPVILLEKAPKVIRKFKELQPEALLVGFKLLVGVTEDELYNVALNLLKKNDCDFVCANDLNNIDSSTHRAILIQKNGSYVNLTTKQEIANEIVKEITNQWK